MAEIYNTNVMFFYDTCGKKKQKNNGDNHESFRIAERFYNHSGKNGKVFPQAAALYRRHLQLLSPHQDQLQTDAGAQKKRSHGHGPSDAKCSIHPSLIISPEIRTESRPATPAAGSATVPAQLA